MNEQSPPPPGKSPPDGPKPMPAFPLNSFITRAFRNMILVFLLGALAHHLIHEWMPETNLLSSLLLVVAYLMMATVTSYLLIPRKF